MKLINEDLGQTYEERYGSIETPVGVGDRKDEKQYPSFTYSDNDEPLDIPKRGKMLIEYEETRREETTVNGKKHYECRIDVRTIISVEGAKKSEKAEKAGDALDAIKEALEAASENDHDEDDE